MVVSSSELQKLPEMPAIETLKNSDPENHVSGDMAAWCPAAGDDQRTVLAQIGPGPCHAIGIHHYSCRLQP